VLDASQNTYHAVGKNSSAGVEVGVGYSVGAQTGVYAYVAASVGQGHSNSDGTTNNNTQLKADTINIASKGDTTLKGAVATANTINVGGKLAIESVQDTSKQESSQTNVGGRVQVSFGTAWDASGSVSQSKGCGSSTAVAEQSGLFAGDGGYHVKAGMIDLKGGAIASTSAENSALATNKLSATDLANEMNYAAASVSLAGGIGGGSGKGDTNADGSAKAAGQQQLFGDRKSGNVTPGLPTVEKGGDRSTTYATVTDGKITIGGVTTGSVKDLGMAAKGRIKARDRNARLVMRF
jgi:filamentous hemagglutinin